MSSAGGLATMEAALRRRFRVVESRVDVQGRSLRILHPASAEELIDEEAFSRDERLPYWAELWPSARVLAERVLALDGGGRSFLELGCGCGLVATCASLAGFRVTASDYYEDAVRFARVNTWRNGAAPAQALVLDWRGLPGGVGRFDVIAASDVLYERPYGELVARAIAALLDARGVAVVADPGRVGRESFLTTLGAEGLEVVERVDVPYRDREIRQTITIFELGRRRGQKVPSRR